MRGWLGLVMVSVMASEAYAQRAPDTATMDRGDGISRIGLDVGLTFLDKPPVAYNAALRIEPYGQYVTDGGVGFYGAIPIAHSFGGDGPPMPDDTTALGNLELGGLYVISGEQLSWVFRVGFALPTATDSDNGPLTNASALYPRMTDTALALPDALHVRLGVSQLVHVRKLYLQADLGVDIGVGLGDTEAAHYLRFNLGGGVDLGAVAIGLELVNLARLDAVDDNEQLTHALSLALRFMGEGLQPVVAIGSPLDESLRGQVALYATAGIQLVLR